MHVSPNRIAQGIDHKTRGGVYGARGVEQREHSMRWTYIAQMLVPLPHAAPELLRGEPSPRSDVWSAGVMAYQLLTGKLPFNDHERRNDPSVSRVWRSILFDDVSNLWGRLRRYGVSDQGVDFCRRLMMRDVYSRPSAQEALSHPWLAAPTKPSSSMDRPLISNDPLAGKAIQRMQAFSAAPERRQRALQAVAAEVMARLGSTEEEDEEGGADMHGHDPSSQLPRASFDFVTSLPHDANGFVKRTTVETALRESGYVISSDEMEQLWSLVRGTAYRPTTTNAIDTDMHHQEGVAGQFSMSALLKRHSNGATSEVMGTGSLDRSADPDYIALPRLLAALLDWSAVAASRQWLSIAKKVFCETGDPTTKGEEEKEAKATTSAAGKSKKRRSESAGDLMETLQACVAPLDLLPAVHHSAAEAEGAAMRATIHAFSSAGATTALDVPAGRATPERPVNASSSAPARYVLRPGGLGGDAAIASASHRANHSARMLPLVGSASSSDASPSGSGNSSPRMHRQGSAGTPWVLSAPPGSPRVMRQPIEGGNDEGQQRGAHAFGIASVDNGEDETLASMLCTDAPADISRTPPVSFADQIAHLQAVVDSPPWGGASTLDGVSSMEGTRDSNDEDSTHNRRVSRGVAKLLRIASLADVNRYDDRMAARHHGTSHEAAEGSVHNADLGARAPLRRSSSMDDLVDRGHSKSDDAAGGGGAKTPPASRRDDGRVLANLLGVEPELLF